MVQGVGIHNQRFEKKIAKNVQKYVDVPPIYQYIGGGTSTYFWTVLAILF